MSETTQASPDAVAGQVDRGVRPHALRLASQLQSAAYSHSYEDAHPANAITRQDKYCATSQRLLSELREAIELLIAERDALKETLHNELDGNLRLRDLGGARPDECMTTFLERVFAERDGYAALLRQALEALEAECAWGGPTPRTAEAIAALREQLVAFNPEDRSERVALAERQRWERALKQTWQAIDPLKPAGQPGSYARGYDNGFAAALQVLRGNLGA